MLKNVNWFKLAARAAVWLALVAATLYYYPAFDRWLYNNLSDPYFRGLSFFTYTYGFGIVHIATVFLVASWAIISSAAVPLADLLVDGIAKLTAQLQPAETADDPA